MVANVSKCPNLRSIQWPRLLDSLFSPQFHTILTQIRSQEKIFEISVLSEQPMFQLDRCNNTIVFLLHLWFCFILQGDHGTRIVINPDQLSYDERILYKSLRGKYGFNAFVSDLISPHRTPGILLHEQLSNYCIQYLIL